MDISKLSRGQLIAGAGGALLIVSLFLSWVSLIGASASAFDAFSGMDIIMLVIGIAAVAFAAVTATEANVEVPAHAGVILAVLGVLIVGWALGWVLEEPSAGFGAWLGLISAGAIAYGGWEADRKPTPMSVIRPAKPAAPSTSTATASEATASAAEATASAAEPPTAHAPTREETPTAQHTPTREETPTAQHAPTREEPSTAEQPAAPTPKRPPIEPPPAPREPSAADDTRVHPSAGSAEPDSM